MAELAWRQPGRSWTAAAAQLGDRAIPIQVDGTDTAELVSTLAGYDIVMNAAGNNTVVPAIQAAMQTGLHYCDANTTIEEPMRLAPDAEAAGITALIGCGGGAPCTSNLMGVHVAWQLEEVKQLQSGWSIVLNAGRELTPQQWAEQPEQSLVVLREYKPFFEWMLGSVTKERTRRVVDYRNGRYVEVDPMRSGIDVPTMEGATARLCHITVVISFSPDSQWTSPMYRRWRCTSAPYLPSFTTCSIIIPFEFSAERSIPRRR